MLLRILRRIGPGLLLALGAPVAFPQAEPLRGADLVAGTPQEAAAETIAAPALPRPDADLLVWRAGRPRLGGLSATRAAGRESERAAARAEIERELAPGSPAAAAWSAYLASLLGGATDDPELWCAAARLAGELGRYELAPALLAGLDGGAEPRTHPAAARGLHSLYGCWFASRADAAPFVAAVAAGDGTRILVADALAREAEADAYLLRALEHDPAEALNHLASPGPAVRGGAARIAGEAVSAQTLPREAVLAALLPQLASEGDAEAFEAVLAALLGLVRGAAPDAPEVAALRDVLAAAAQGPPGERSLAVARGLSRLPWSAGEPPSSPGALAAVGWIGGILDAVRGIEGGDRPSDPDAMLAVLDALQVLCDRIEGETVRAELRRNDARRPIFEILQDPAQPPDVRVTAVGLLGHFALGEDAPLIDAVLREAPAERALVHALLGTLRAILPGFAPGDPATGELVRTVARLAGSSNPDLRRRALAVLGDGQMAPHTSLLDPSFLIERLGAEEVPDLQLVLLALIERAGRPALLSPLLHLPTFDRLATGDLERVARLSAALGELADDRPLERMAAAKRLVAVADDATRLSRLQRAITLVAGLSPAMARTLGEVENQRVGAWAWELHAAGISLGSLPGGAALRARLVEIHLARPAPSLDPAGAPALLPEAARQHLLGIYRSEIAEEAGAPIDPTSAEEAFARALELAPLHSDPAFAGLVRRDRARCRAARGDQKGALEDYRALVENGVLDLTDLRQAGAMIGAQTSAEPAQAGSAARERCDLLDRLVRRPSWRSEPATVRMEDLRQLAAAAHATGPADRSARLERFAALLADLPSERPAMGSPAASPPLWGGLVRDDASFAELVRLRDAALAALAPPAGSDGAPPPAGDPGGRR
ncbi:MAG: hypothetical protein AB1726_00060 [Planctomycetota bacterium]